MDFLKHLRQWRQREERIAKLEEKLKLTQDQLIQFMKLVYAKWDEECPTPVKDCAP